MARFFIDRPIFAWVVALAIAIAGLVALTQMPISQYPSVAAPSIRVSASYPGASADTIDESLVSVIEQALTSVDNLIYMESVSQPNRANITLTFSQGTDPALAQVDVQNGLSQATPRLPNAVVQQGIEVDKANNNTLMLITLNSTAEDFNITAQGDYVARNILPEIQRVPGVGIAELRGSEYAMRIWVDPAKLTGYGISMTQVNEAIRSQNAQVSAGAIGARPNLSSQSITADVLVSGQLSSPAAFGNIVLRANPDGSTVRLRDVARIELGADSYTVTSRASGRPAVLIVVQPAPGANALETAKAIRAKMDELSRYFPAGMTYDIPYDTSLFAEASIARVVETLFEAVALVFLVMLLFLQNIRYTLIPTIVVPVALLGTIGVLLATGFSINMLTMFAMVLAIGILVDDAIVVVENVERIMSEERLSPRQATRKAMRQITGAIVGITVVLVSVFIPMAFFSGAAGMIYRQFSVTMATSILFSAFLALSLTPALCATLLKPIAAGHRERRGLLGRFNRGFQRTTDRYQGTVARVAARSGRYLLIYAMLVAVVALLATRLPTGFLPMDDRGDFIAITLLPPGATDDRTEAVVKEVESYFLAQPEVVDFIPLIGWSVYGTGQNASNSFITLKDWGDRTEPEQSMQAVIERANRHFAQMPGAVTMAVALPPILEMGSASGVTLRLQDRGNAGRETLRAARDQLLALAADSPVLTGVRIEGLPEEPQLHVSIDREKAQALGIDFTAISSVLSTAIGSTYINDFPNAGRMQRVVVQADAHARMQPEDVLDLGVANRKGEIVPLATFAAAHWQLGSKQMVRYNGYPAERITATAAPGYSTGDAMAEFERLATRLPAGIGIDWTGQSREEKLAGSQATWLLLFSLLAIFLCLAALYESWTIPLAVILVVPVGVMGSLVAANLGGLPNDIYFKVGLITIIGLASKNAILIVEFAKDLRAAGMGLLDAVVEAARLRFRPIIMTSMAFTLGVLPLAIATGAGAAAQRAIGIGVVGGMITATVFAIVFVPVFFVAIGRWLLSRPAKHDEEDADDGGGQHQGIDPAARLGEG